MRRERSYCRLIRLRPHTDVHPGVSLLNNNRISLRIHFVASLRAKRSNDKSSSMIFRLHEPTFWFYRNPADSIGSVDHDGLSEYFECIDCCDLTIIETRCASLTGGQPLGIGGGSFCSSRRLFRNSRASCTLLWPRHYGTSRQATHIGTRNICELVVIYSSHA